MSDQKQNENMNLIKSIDGLNDQFLSANNCAIDEINQLMGDDSLLSLEKYMPIADGLYPTKTNILYDTIRSSFIELLSSHSKTLEQIHKLDNIYKNTTNFI